MGVFETWERKRLTDLYKLADPFVVSIVDFAVASIFQWRFLIEGSFRVIYFIST